jgi:predicted dehydrogenase
MIRFAIVGGGWRARFFLRIVEQCPDLFEVVALATRSPERGAALGREYGVPIVESLADVVAADPEFTVVSVAREASARIVLDLVADGQAVLCETPPAPDVEGLTPLLEAVAGGARIQVAEQYPRHPMISSQLAIARSGLLGTISHVNVSMLHDFHAAALVRAALGTGLQDATVQAREFVSPLVAGPTRSGGPDEEQIRMQTQVVAVLDFDGASAIIDTTPEQYFSWIRTNRLLIRGDRGEIIDDRVRYLKDFATPIDIQLHRMDLGHEVNHEGFALKGILFGDEWIYRNPFAPARLTDDEIAIAAMLVGMSDYAGGGGDVYSLAEAAQDHAINWAIRDSIASGRPVRTDGSRWRD